MEQLTRDLYGARELWAAVLVRAVDDLAEKPELQARALRWIRSPDKRVGSFLWICDHLGIESRCARQALANRIPTIQLTHHGKDSKVYGCASVHGGSKDLPGGLRTPTALVTLQVRL
jgi:hypothetical protein